MENNHENGYAKKELFPKTGVILGQNCPWLSYVALNDFFYKNLFCKKQCKYATKIGVAKIRDTFYSFLKGKGVLLYLCQTLPSISKITHEKSAIRLY